VTEPDTRDLHGPLQEIASGSTKVTYLGHASILIESGEEAILTDPVFSDRIGRFFTKRVAPSSFGPEALQSVVGVLISHPHHDHLDYPSLKRIRPTPPIVVPWGVAPTMRWRGFHDVRVVRPWESVSIGAWRVVAVPSRHFGGRLPLVGTSGHVGYVLTGPSCIYFAGDTGLDDRLFREIGRQFEIDLAILPIAGAVFPGFRPNHMNSRDALQAFHCLVARQMIPMHFGTFPASFEHPEEPLRSLIQESGREGVQDRVRILPEGGSLLLAQSGTPRESGSGPMVRTAVGSGA
jgi:L-ascorbate metabolism protein UlaG (beta-lactamase superfamily)